MYVCMYVHALLTVNIYIYKIIAVPQCVDLTNGIVCQLVHYLISQWIPTNNERKLEVEWLWNWIVVNRVDDISVYVTGKFITGHDH